MKFLRFIPIALALLCAQTLAASGNSGGGAPVDPPQPPPVVIPEPSQMLPTLDEFLDLIFQYPTVHPRRQAYHQARTAYLVAQAEGPVAPDVLHAFLTTTLAYVGAVGERLGTLQAEWLAAGHTPEAIHALVSVLNEYH